MEGKFSFWAFFFFFGSQQTCHQGVGVDQTTVHLFVLFLVPGSGGALSSPTCAFVPGPKQSEKGLPTPGTFRMLGERLKNSLGCQLARASSAGRGAWALTGQDRGTSETARGSGLLFNLDPGNSSDWKAS